MQNFKSKLFWNKLKLQFCQELSSLHAYKILIRYHEKISSFSKPCSMYKHSASADWVFTNLTFNFRKKLKSLKSFQLNCVISTVDLESKYAKLFMQRAG